MSAIDRDPKTNQPSIHESQLPNVNNDLPEVPDTLQANSHEVKKGINKKALIGGLGGGALALALVVGGVAAAQNNEKSPSTVETSDPNVDEEGEVVPANNLTTEQWDEVISNCPQVFLDPENLAVLPKVSQVDAEAIYNISQFKDEGAVISIIDILASYR